MVLGGFGWCVACGLVCVWWRVLSFPVCLKLWLGCFRLDAFGGLCILCLDFDCYMSFFNVLYFAVVLLGFLEDDLNFVINYFVCFDCVMWFPFGFVLGRVCFVFVLWLRIRMCLRVPGQWFGGWCVECFGFGVERLLCLGEVLVLGYGFSV